MLPSRTLKASSAAVSPISLGFTAETQRAQKFALELTAIWALYNAGLITLTVRRVLTRSHRRQQYRFETDIAGSFEEINIAGARRFDASIVDLNPVGLGFRHNRPLAAGQHVRVRIDLPDGKPIEATAVVVNCLPPGDEREGWRVGARFAEIDDSARDALTLFLFSDVAIPEPGRATRLSSAA